MANPYRGEVELTLNGKVYTLRPTFAALCEIEHATGKSLISLISNLAECGILLNEQIIIIKAGIKATTSLPDDIDEQLQNLGLAKMLPIVCKFLEQGLNI